MYIQTGLSWPLHPSHLSVRTNVGIVVLPQVIAISCTTPPKYPSKPGCFSVRKLWTNSIVLHGFKEPENQHKYRPRKGSPLNATSQIFLIYPSCSRTPHLEWIGLFTSSQVLPIPSYPSFFWCNLGAFGLDSSDQNQHFEVCEQMIYCELVRNNSYHHVTQWIRLNKGRSQIG